MSRESEVLRPNLVAGPAARVRAQSAPGRAGGAAVRGRRRVPRAAPGRAARRDADARRDRAPARATRTRTTPTQAAGATSPTRRGCGRRGSTRCALTLPNGGPILRAGWKPGASAEVASGTSRIGWAGTLSQALLRDWDIEVPVHLFVVLLDAAVRRRDRTRPRVTLPGRFPPVRRDLAFFVPAARDASRARDARCARRGGEWLASIELFDVYAGPGTPAGHEEPGVRAPVPAPGAHARRSPRSRPFRTAWWRPCAKACGGRLRER